MKYWFFDGNDVIGPFTPQELSARADFSAASMIVPENESENQSAWQIATSFDDFLFDETGKPLPIETPQPTQTPASSVPPAEQTPVQETQTPQPQPTPQTPSSESHPHYTVSLDLEATQKTPQPVSSVPLAAPISLANSTEEILPLPGEDQAPQDSPAQTKPEQQTTAPDTTAPHLVPLSEEAGTTNASELPSLESAALPPAQPEQDDPFTVFQPIEEPAAQAENPAPQLTAPAEEHSVHEALEPGAQVVRSPDDFSPDEISMREVIRPRLEPNTEIAKFLDTQRKVRHPERKRVRMILWLIVILLLPALTALTIYLLPTPPAKKSDAAAAATSASAAAPAKTTAPQSTSAKPASKPTPVAPQQANPAAAPQEPATPPVVTAPKNTAADKAIAIVQNYQLPGNRGTIASYFDRAYKAQLESGYTAQWSAEPLHKSVYIVKYRLTKTRTEPIVYVFQADASKGKLTGALNNVALDLVGKI